VIVARRDPDGVVTVPGRPYIVIPAAVRCRCGLRAGDRVLLAALPADDTLAAYLFAVVDQAMRAHGPLPRGDGDGRERRRGAGRVPGGGGRGGADPAGADGPVGGGPDGCPAGPGKDTDVRGVRAGRVGGGYRRDPAGVWLVLEPGYPALGDRRLDEPTPSEIQQLMVHVKTHVVARRNARGGRCAAEHLVAALQCLYRHAADDGLISQADNPALKVDKPRRLPSARRAVADSRLAEINQAAATTGNDPELDTLLLRLHTETACRGGALALRPQDLDPDQCLILLREKGETVRWQPVSPTLMAHLQQHGQDRHALRGEQLLRYASGQPITSRRYDHIWGPVDSRLRPHRWVPCLPEGRNRPPSLCTERESTMTVHAPAGRLATRHADLHGAAAMPRDLNQEKVSAIFSGATSHVGSPKLASQAAPCHGAANSCRVSYPAFRSGEAHVGSIRQYGLW
jgi:hypothetical protein